MSGLPERICVIGNYLPRKCGIATFTTDVCESVAKEYEAANVVAVPVNDTEEGYNYPQRVHFELAEQEIASYMRAADFININNFDVVNVQHEFGIFGGPSGSHLLALLRELRTPIVTTLHTVLEQPSANQRRVMEDLCQISDRLIVMSRKAYGFLDSIYNVPEEKIDFVHHGVPDVPFIDPNYYKDQFGVEGKTVMLTFGLLSPNKGVEHAIEALPAILEKHPDVVYLVLGATHPHLMRTEGESYRLKLVRLAKSKGVDENVVFHNRFVSIEELNEFIGAADVYVTPYLNIEQITSGTLAYTVGAGKAIVSTPYWYAEELLDENRGVLVPPREPEAIADAVNSMLENETERHAMRKKAYQFGRDMIWPTVARGYMNSFERARQERTGKPKPVFRAKTLGNGQLELPPLKLAHLRALTDCTGLIQHAKFVVPDYSHGYSIDDNARALILAVLLEEISERPASESRYLARRYMAFMYNAFNQDEGRFRNFMGYNREWLEEVGSADSHCRSLWAMGVTAGRSRDRGLRDLACRLFEAGLPAIHKFTAPRSWAYALLGVQEFLRRFYGHRAAEDARREMAMRLLDLYQSNRDEDWKWFEDELTYANAKLPHALLLAGRWLGDNDMFDAGIEALSWLAEAQRMEGEHFVPIGCNGFYKRDRERARFDQQPIEAYAMTSACLEAFRITGERYWMDEARRAFDWFLGGNDLGAPLYEPATGACYDGLSPEQVNQNQGAESTLAFLLSLVEMTVARHVINEPESDLE